MKSRILSALLLVLIMIRPGVTFADNCGYTQEELEKLGPWVCPENLPAGYRPGPGSRTAPKPIQLDEVTITATRIPTYFPLYGMPKPPFPMVLNPNYDPTAAYKPLPGDPLKCPTIAPSE